ncbi:hypothetical protein WICPIJ_003964 [Wickerhamomyces pijperi]|uniref:Uncharacterized protein n=1 Tax=Wickerhamomyces pijperi TaxID=599730 RepID=A0A9P8Q6W5_WICPI|nr:hypothetical protein WICPIJ_003964 [Wickerhamomyces pijperi]
MNWKSTEQWFKIYLAILATFPLSKAASTSSKTKNGEGMNEWMANNKDKAAMVFSPPDRNSISLNLFIGGIAWYLIPDKYGSSSSSKVRIDLGGDVVECCHEEIETSDNLSMALTFGDNWDKVLLISSNWSSNSWDILELFMSLWRWSKLL